MTTESRDRGHITVRVPRNMQDTLKYAADLAGVPLNLFIIEAALGEAHRVMERERMIELSSRDAVVLLKLLKTRARPNAALTKALRDYRNRSALE